MYFNDGYFMGGMHGLWWIFWVALVGVIAFYGWGRPSEKRRPPARHPTKFFAVGWQTVKYRPRSTKSARRCWIATAQARREKNETGGGF
ncbi:hypothetical protein LPB72_09825 [Hydrogenophaga crassostreae]|uniref:Uncharacterized protein n=1 Tax=Hydrogenophaga crassostreae TaxID=1763535 RepID=A0A167HR81_9BURK|nr:hypothetical protein LPB072_11205 [Hydrogenophaga crassostreae]OAD41620.1 hypothetical protein LPB72_09825 [Hydrogenophaga crassostreae]